MRRRSCRLGAAAAAVLCAVAGIVGAATAASAGGGRDIKNAPAVKKNTTIQSRLKLGALQLGFSGEYYMLDLVKGDRVWIRTVSPVDTTAPCQNLFPPGTDDSTVKFVEGSYIAPASQKVEGPRNEQRWVATRTGSYVLAFNNFVLDKLDCLAADPRIRYTFVIVAPHLLKLYMKSPKTIAAQKKTTIEVIGKNGEQHPVTGAFVKLTARTEGKPRVTLGQSRLAHGKASFTFSLPARFRGKVVRIAASGGDGTLWTRAAVGRSFAVR